MISKYEARFENTLIKFMLVRSTHMMFTVYIQRV